jgi:acyl-CoA reductase-like NAD-dependent aldehyde dehydrogenase
MLTTSQLRNPAIFKNQSYINGEWVEAKSSKRFDVVGLKPLILPPPATAKLSTDPGTGNVWATAPDNDASDVDAAVSTAHAAFQSYRKVNPRTRARWLLKWDALIRENREDLGKIITYETGKPLAESDGEIEYALGFTWWFAGEAERITGTVSQPSAPGRRIFTVKQPIGVAAALVPWNFPVA